jgi:hypothetical protein
MKNVFCPKCKAMVEFPQTKCWKCGTVVKKEKKLEK